VDEQLESDLTHESLIHDLNNVFETITDVAELLSADKHWKALAATLNRSATRGRRLLGAIPDRTPKMAAIIEDAIQSVTDYCIASRRPRMRFVRQIPEDFHLPGSAKDWERVFVNLFLNSVQMMQKPGRIDIAAQRNGEGVSITISDNGPGIPDDILPRIFKPHVSTKVKANGRSGLGLAIVASIVKKYSGRVQAGNRERGTGAVFSIYFQPF
jgi:signal transduction histidine kinase